MLVTFGISLVVLGLFGFSYCVLCLITDFCRYGFDICGFVILGFGFGFLVFGFSGVLVVCCFWGWVCGILLDLI